MVVLVWIFLGLAAGLIASRRFHHTAGALVGDVTLGVAGAIVGGLAFNSLGLPRDTAFAVAAALVAAAGSVVTLAAYRAIFHEA